MNADTNETSGTTTRSSHFVKVVTRWLCIALGLFVLYTAAFGQFESLLQREDSVGRRLDFLLQEMAREANTIGSKGQDVGIAHAVVELKAEIERMREQVQNVE